MAPRCNTNLPFQSHDFATYDRLAESTLDFVSAARSLGAPAPRILLQHLLPNAAGPVIVRLTYGIPQAVSDEIKLTIPIEAYKE